MVKKELREERTLQQPMVNTETIMLSECATLLRDIPLIWSTVFGEKRRKFFFYS